MNTTRQSSDKSAKSVSSADLDRRLSAILRASEPASQPDTWFTRRVLNRLPARRERRLVSIPELLAFIMVVCFCAVIVAGEIRKVMDLQTGDTFDPSRMIIAAGMAAVATLYIAIPVVRRALN